MTDYKIDKESVEQFALGKANYLEVVKQKDGSLLLKGNTSFSGKIFSWLSSFPVFNKLFEEQTKSVNTVLDNLETTKGEPFNELKAILSEVSNQDKSGTQKNIDRIASRLFPGLNSGDVETKKPSSSYVTPSRNFKTILSDALEILKERKFSLMNTQTTLQTNKLALENKILEIDDRRKGYIESQKGANVSTHKTMLELNNAKKRLEDSLTNVNKELVSITTDLSAIELQEQHVSGMNMLKKDPAIQTMRLADLELSTLEKLDLENLNTVSPFFKIITPDKFLVLKSKISNIPKELREEKKSTLGTFFNNHPAFIMHSPLSEHKKSFLNEKWAGYDSPIVLTKNDLKALKELGIDPEEL